MLLPLRPEAGLRCLVRWLSRHCSSAWHRSVLWRRSRTAKSVLLRGVLALVGVILLARGLLVVPFVVAGQREWRTPIGKIIVTGDWFTAGSLIVLAIGALMVLGVYQTRSERTPDVSGTS